MFHLKNFLSKVGTRENLSRIKKALNKTKMRISSISQKHNKFPISKKIFTSFFFFVSPCDNFSRVSMMKTSVGGDSMLTRRKGFLYIDFLYFCSV